jgi:NAD(P)-dependent dehydrogenase (short-subunit alcohol dehydrogenase family)
MDNWKGKTAIVTGAASGIGAALSTALRARGAFVVASDVAAGAESRLDVRDGEAFNALVTKVVGERGQLDLLFNNAGVAIAGEAHELTAAHWDRVLDVNVRGVVNGVLAAYPVMRRQRTGHIVNVASLAGLGPAPFLVPYAASKHAIVGLSTSLRGEAADYGVRVSVVCPSAVETPLLDRDNPADLPAISWKPDMRRYLERLAGPPCSAELFAREALDGVGRNKAVIVIPARARIAWRMGRLFPGLVDQLVLRAVRAERVEREGE